MSLALILVGVLALSVYWFVTQIQPQRRRAALLRPALRDGLLQTINDRRHEDGQALLELDIELTEVAEQKAVHQILTGRSDEGWNYPPSYGDVLGRSLLMEVLLTSPIDSLSQRLARQRDLFDPEWVRCGIGVAGGSGQVVIAAVLSREAWEPVPELGGLVAEGAI